VWFGDRLVVTNSNNTPINLPAQSQLNPNLNGAILFTERRPNLFRRTYCFAARSAACAAKRIAASRTFDQSPAISADSAFVNSRIDSACALLNFATIALIAHQPVLQPVCVFRVSLMIEFEMLFAAAIPFDVLTPAVAVVIEYDRGRARLRAAATSIFRVPARALVVSDLVPIAAT
jgi:hypothetical protein